MAKKGKGEKGAFLEGADARKRMVEESKHQEALSEQRKAKVGMPFEFYMKVGETRDIIVLDDNLNFGMYEHNMYRQGSKSYRPPAVCIKEHDNCPLCEVMEKESYYVLILTVLDLTPYKDKNDKKIKFTRRYLKVKASQQKKFARKCEREGTLRGAKFTMTRDGEKDARIGNDIEFDGFMKESELRKYVRNYKDRKGEKHTEKCYEVMDYKKYFPVPAKSELQRLAKGEGGGGATPGSREESEEEMIKGKKGKKGKKYKEKENDDDKPWDEKKGDSSNNKASKRRSARRDAINNESKDKRSRKR